MAERHLAFTDAFVNPLSHCSFDSLSLSLSALLVSTLAIDSDSSCLPCVGPWQYHSSARSKCAIEKFWVPLGALVKCLKAEDPADMSLGTEGAAWVQLGGWCRAVP